MKISLTFKVVVVVTALVVLGGGVTAYLVYFNSSTALKNSISSNQLEITKQTLDKIDRFLYEREADIETATSRQQIRDYLSEKTSVTTNNIDQNLDYFKTVAGAWDNINVFGMDQTVAASSNGHVNAATTASPQFKRAFALASSGQASYSDAFLPAGVDSPVMVFMAPIRSQTASQQIVGVLEGELAWPTIEEILQSLSGPEALLINSSGQSIDTNHTPADSGKISNIFEKSYQNNPTFQLSRSSPYGSTIMPGFDNPKERFVQAYVKETGYLDYKGNGWTLILETSENEAFKPAKDLAKKLLVIFFVILIGSVILFVFVLHRLVLRPIYDFKEVIQRISKGDFALRATVKGRDELGDLANGLNDMADNMQFAYNNLKTSSEEAENEKRTIETLLENLPVGVHVVKAPSGESLMLNRVGADLIGRGALPGVARSGSYAEVFDIIKEDGSPYPENELPMNITLKEGKVVFKDDLYVRRPDGAIMTLRTITAPIHFIDGSVRTAVGVFEDISKERALERSREEFFSIASHELRTPLTAIMGNTSLIQQYYNQELPDDSVREMVSDIHESSKRLIAIVNDFLDTSRLEQKRMKYDITTFNIVDAAHSVIKEYQVTGSRKKIHLEIAEPHEQLPRVRADVNRVKQVLINLVGNALKFTEDGSVTISFQPSDRFIKVLVSDTGKGISAEAQKLLFKKFEQTSSSVLTRDSVRGTGLGLYISKLIVEQMGGTINLESSQVGVGTTFGFTVPVDDGSPSPLSTEAAASEASSTA